MTVVAAFKLDQLAAAGGTARQADGTHGGFGAGTDQTHHVHRGHELEDFFCQLNFALGRRAVGKTLQHRLLHCLDHRWMAVPQNHGSPGADVVDEALPVGVPEIGTLGPRDKARCATDGLERPDG